MIDFDVVILAGGGGKRMGGVDKPALTVGRISMLQRVIDAAGGAHRTVVVGPPRSDLDARILQTRELPAGSGPVAAIAAGIACLPSDGAGTVIVLASDVPFADETAVNAVLTALTSHAAAFAVDTSGRTQYLFGAWRTEVLRHAVAALPGAANQRVGSIVPADHVLVAVADIDDCDTPSDLAAARERAANARPEPTVPTVDEARDSIRRRLSSIPVRTVSLGDAYGSVLAQPILAATPLPPVDISAMDGFAVAGDGPWTILAPVAYAGTALQQSIPMGHAIRIATGARVPEGATSVLRDEHVIRHSDSLSLRAGMPGSDDTRRAGEDWYAGAELVSAGTEVSPAVLSVALSGEVSQLVVRGPVRARVVLSGTEIRADGPLTSGQTRDSIGPVFSHYLAACGMILSDTVRLEDSPSAFEDMLAQSTGADVVIVVGATGAGAADQLRTALVRADAEIVVHRALIRPGGSQVTAVLPSGAVILGLPGNPLAAVGTLMSIAPAIVDALTGRTPRAPLLGLLSTDESHNSPTGRLVPVVRDGARWRVARHVRTAHLLNLVDHDALAVIPPNLRPGAPVELLMLPR